MTAILYFSSNFASHLDKISLVSTVELDLMKQILRRGAKSCI